MLKSTISLFLLILLSACSSFKVEEELKASDDLEALRPIQSRLFPTTNRTALTAAAAEALTEMGFTIVQQEPGLGFVSATQQVNAFDAGEVIEITAVILLAVLTHGNLPGGGGSGIDDHETFSANVVILPEEGKDELVRLTVQRSMYNTHNRITETEHVANDEVYADFFKRLQNKLRINAVALQEEGL
jgi:hypothetical protein